MSSDADNQRNSWGALGSVLVWTVIVSGVLVGFFTESLPLIQSTLIAGWGLFILLFLWRIARGIEHLAYDNSVN